MCVNLLPWPVRGVSASAALALPGTALFFHFEMLVNGISMPFVAVFLWTSCFYIIKIRRFSVFFAPLFTLLVAYFSVFCFLLGRISGGDGGIVFDSFSSRYPLTAASTTALSGQLFFAQYIFSLCKVSGCALHRYVDVFLFSMPSLLSFYILSYIYIHFKI